MTKTLEKPVAKRAIAKPKPARTIVQGLPGGVPYYKPAMARAQGAKCAMADIAADGAKHQLATDMATLNGFAELQHAAMTAARDGYTAGYVRKRPDASLEQQQVAARQFTSVIRAGVKVILAKRSLPARVSVWQACAGLLDDKGALRKDVTEEQWNNTVNPPLKALVREGKAKGTDGTNPPSAPYGAEPDSAAATLPGKPVPPIKTGHGDGENPFTAQAYRANAAAIRRTLAECTALRGFTAEMGARLQGVTAFLDLNAAHAAAD